jgi:hypothetical protein
VALLVNPTSLTSPPQRPQAPSYVNGAVAGCEGRRLFHKTHMFWPCGVCVTPPCHLGSEHGDARGCVSGSAAGYDCSSCQVDAAVCTGVCVGWGGSCAPPGCVHSSMGRSGVTRCDELLSPHWLTTQLTAHPLLQKGFLAQQSAEAGPLVTCATHTWVTWAATVCTTPLPYMPAGQRTMGRQGGGRVQSRLVALRCHPSARGLLEVHSSPATLLSPRRGPEVCFLAAAALATAVCFLAEQPLQQPCHKPPGGGDLKGGGGAADFPAICM